MTYGLLPLFEATYPDRPGFRPTDTSKAAADKAQRFDIPVRERCISILKSHGPMTADEVAECLKLGVLSVRPRIAQLNRKGLVSDTGERRCNRQGNPMIVWSAA